MRLNKAKGRMFQTVSHTGTYFQGCSHDCCYCWAKIMGISHLPKLMQKDEHEYLKVRDAIVFLNSAHDSFAECIPADWIMQMLRWINRQHPSNRFLLQSKNTPRMPRFLKSLLEIKDRILLGTTIESTRSMKVYSKAPEPRERAWMLAHLREKYGFKTFLSLEPLCNFNVKDMVQWIRAVFPEAVEIGLDNYEGKHPLKLKKPTPLKYLKFRGVLSEIGVNFAEKPSIVRWMKNT